MAFGVLEVGARLMTHPSEANGMPAILHYGLLPHRPPRALVEQWLVASSTAAYLVSDPDLGWTIARGARAQMANGAVYESNAQGVRSPNDRAVAAAPPAGTVRIVSVGDSFTHGDEVSYAGTWQAELERLRRDVEVINLGVPGYGTDQAYLRYRRDGAPLHPDIALLGIWPEDIARNLNVSRYNLNTALNPFLVKPRLVIADGALHVIGAPVPLGGEDAIRLLAEPGQSPILAHDRWYDARDATPHWYHHVRAVNAALSVASYTRKRALLNRLFSGEDPSAIELTVAIARAFATAARAGGAAPLIVLMPVREFVQQPQFNPASFPLTRALRASGLDVIDLSPAMQRAFAGRERAELCFPTGHYTERGNAVLAAALDLDLRPWIARVAMPAH